MKLMQLRKGFLWGIIGVLSSVWAVWYFAAAYLIAARDFRSYRNIHHEWPHLFMLLSLISRCLVVPALFMLLAIISFRRCRPDISWLAIVAVTVVVGVFGFGLVTGFIILF